MLTNYLKKRFMKEVYTKSDTPDHTIKGHVSLVGDNIYLYLENVQKFMLNRFWFPKITTRLYPFYLPSNLVDLLIRFDNLDADKYVKFDFKAYRDNIVEHLATLKSDAENNAPNEVKDAIVSQIDMGLRYFGDPDERDTACIQSFIHGGYQLVLNVRNGSQKTLYLATTFHGMLTLVAVTVVCLKDTDLIVDVHKIDLSKEFINGILEKGLNIFAIDEDVTSEGDDTK